MKMGAQLIVLLAIGLAGCCTSKESDLQLNGLIRDGWLVSTSDSPPGVFPLAVYRGVNSKLYHLMQERYRELHGACFLVPREAGYEIVVLTNQRLSQKTRNEIYEMVNKTTHDAEAEYIRSNEAP